MDEDARNGGHLFFGMRHNGDHGMLFFFSNAVICEMMLILRRAVLLENVSNLVCKSMRPLMSYLVEAKSNCDSRLREACNVFFSSVFFPTLSLSSRSSLREDGN